MRTRQERQGALQDAAWKTRETAFRSSARRLRQQWSEVERLSLPLDRLSPDTWFPLAPDARCLEEAPALMHCAPPVVFLAPMRCASDSSSPASHILESMLRFQLRMPVEGRAALNLVPWAYMAAPYAGAGPGAQARERRAEDYKRDAKLLGAHVLVHGRIDALQDKAIVQVALVDLRTMQSDAWTSAVPVARTADLLGAAAARIARFSGLPPESAAEFDRDARAGDSGVVPTAAALELALRPCAEDADPSATLAAVADAAPACPWLFAHFAGRTRGPTAIAVVNEALRRWPDDARLLLAKAHALHDAGELNAALPMVAEAVRRQPHSLHCAAWLAASLDDLRSPLRCPPAPPNAYRGAYRHLSQLLMQHPDNWALRWDRAAMAAQTCLHSDLLVYADALAAVTSEPETLPSGDWQQLAGKYDVLAEQALEDLRAAAARRDDCPDLPVALACWERRLAARRQAALPDQALLRQ